MYTFNYLIYGHNIQGNDHYLANLIYEYDISHNSKVKDGGHEFRIYIPYHGSLVDGDPINLIFGLSLTDSDGNRNYIKEIKQYDKEEEILKHEYNLLLEEFMKELKSEEPELADKIQKFIDSNNPELYEVEASS